MKIFLRKLVLMVLKWQAKLALRRHHPMIIAITGSVGKTTTKEQIFHVLKTARVGQVFRSRGNLNTDFGAPLSILGYKESPRGLGWFWLIFAGWVKALKSHYPAVLVLEIAADKPGDIQYLTSIIKPNITVMTRICPAHLKQFKTEEAIYREKKILAENTLEEGYVIYNHDDEYLCQMTKDARIRAKLISYGFSHQSDLLASNLVLFERGMVFDVKIQDKTYSLKMPLYSKSQVYSLLAAIMVGYIMRIEPEKIVTQLESLPQLKGRLRFLAGVNDTQLLDDTYNANPASMRMALEVLDHLRVKNGRKIAVLGDMLELDHFSQTEHREIGKLAAKIADVLVTVGSESLFIADAAIKAGLPKEKVIQVKTVGSAIPKVIETIERGDLILLKASQGIRLEHLTKELLAHKNQAKKLLVRQNDFWLSSKE